MTHGAYVTNGITAQFESRCSSLSDDVHLLWYSMSYHSRYAYMTQPSAHLVSGRLAGVIVLDSVTSGLCLLISRG